MKKYTIFDASVIFEANVSAGGNCYLVIYGRHVNGYFCAIPNYWKISCEMAEPSDRFYNERKLIDAGIYPNDAKEICKAIIDLAGGENE